MRRMGNNSSTLQAPGGHSDHQDPRGSKDRDKISLPKEVFLPVESGIRLLGVSPQLAPQGAPVGPAGKYHIPIDNARTGGSPRLLYSQKVDADLPHLAPNQRRTPRKKPATGTTITKSADIERPKTNTGMNIRAAMVTNNIIRNIMRGLLNQTARHHTRARFRENTSRPSQEGKHT